MVRIGGEPQPQITAYLVADQNLNLSDDQTRADWLQSLRAYLQRFLPDYMVPAGFHLLAQLPLNTHGKVDRQALQARLEDDS